MKLIPLSQNKYAKVDDVDYDFLSQWHWHHDGKYARRNIQVDGKKVHIYMHKEVLGTTGMVDHKDRDKLNNQRENLRPANCQLNAVNISKSPNKSSRYKGVRKGKNRWRSQLWYNDERVYSALFEEERWAAVAHDLNAPALFGDYTYLNFPDAILIVRE